MGPYVCIKCHKHLNDTNGIILLLAPGKSIQGICLDCIKKEVR